MYVYEFMSICVRDFGRGMFRVCVCEGICLVLYTTVVVVKMLLNNNRLVLKYNLQNGYV